MTLLKDRLEVIPGGGAALPVQVVRKGYAGPIDLSVSGSPGLSGTATIKAGKNAGLLMVVANAKPADGAAAIQRARQGHD